MAAHTAERGLEGGRCFGLLGLGLLAAQRGRQRLGRRGFMEGTKKVANFDAVVVLELRPRADLLVVDEGAIAAVLVLDEEFALDTKDLRVFPADGVSGDDDVAVG